MSINWLKFKLTPNRNPKLVWGSLLVGGGLLYLKVWLPMTGIGIPCVFYELTGFYTPGCGITRASVSLLKLDLYQAFRYNPLVFFLVPLYLAYTVAKSKQQRRTGNAIMAVMLIMTISFGVLRNFPAFVWLAPTIVR